ncbi:MAG: phosphate ABC transporter permease subunit PstC [Verrucomicrobiota bacterium]
MKNPNRFDRKRLRLDHVIKWFFASNALLAIVVLALITLFLFREGAGFFPQNLQNLRLYRRAGLEYVGFMRDQVEAHTALNRSLQDLRLRQVAALLKQGKTPEEATAALSAFDAFTAGFDASVDDLRGLVSDLTDSVSAIKEKAKVHEDALEQRRFLLKAGRNADAVSVTPVDFTAELAPVRAAFPLYQTTARAFRAKQEDLLRQRPELPVSALQPRFDAFQKAARVYLASFPETERKLRQWNPDTPVPWARSVTSFLFGSEWITNSFWQDWYGILPLLTGSLLVSLIALAIAVPLGVCAAVYVSELARPLEAQFIKPFLEFIAAIPSVVLGFFGIAVLGEGIRAMTHWEALSWISSFPIAERLNAFTAGALLALMAIPTIFSLSEDALNSVPRAFREASYAMGATRLQTVVRILIPAALSGILSAVLLGFGRVIGETMVVLLCAGNRIATPDFTQGLGAIFQPVHTMTGIVAQELGEVPSGTIHYRALFIVGLFLFFLALGINGLAQAVVRRFKISIG